MNLGLSPALVVTAARDHDVALGNDAMSVALMPRQSRSWVAPSPGPSSGREPWESKGLRSSRGRALIVWVDSPGASTEAFCAVEAPDMAREPESLAAQSCEIPEA